MDPERIFYSTKNTIYNIPPHTCGCSVENREHDTEIYIHMKKSFISIFFWIEPPQNVHLILKWL